MSIKICTRQFEASHARKPKGWGVWGFFYEDADGFKDEDNIVFTPYAMSFTDASRWIKAHARASADPHVAYAVVAP